MEEYVSSSLAAGTISPSSPTGAGFFFVEISSTFEVLQGMKVFSKLDLRYNYRLVRIHEEDEWKTAFNTPAGHYEYLVIPFRLTNAPAVFQALVNDVLRDMLNRFVFVYLDDILIFSKTVEEHVQHVCSVLQRLLESSLFVKAEKCEFHSSLASFLRYIITPGSIQMDPAKISAVLDWPNPDSRKQLQRFLRYANFYHRFIRNYSSVAAASPLTTLTSINRLFLWSPEAFRALKETSRPPSFRCPTQHDSLWWR